MMGSTDSLRIGFDGAIMIGSTDSLRIGFDGALDDDPLVEEKFDGALFMREPPLLEYLARTAFRAAL